MRPARSKVSDRDALAVLFAAWVRHRDTAFAVDRANREPGSLNYPALAHAETRGWVWFPAPDRAVITTDGRRALAPFGVREGSDGS